MKGYSAGDRTVEYFLLVAAGYACAYSLLTPFIPPRIIEGNLLPMFICCAAVLLANCFFRRAARAAGFVTSGAVILLSLYQLFWGDSVEWIASVLHTTGEELIQSSGFASAGLCVLTALVSLLTAYCSRRRLTIVIFWVGTTALSGYLSYTGHGENLPALLVITGCCAALFYRVNVKSGLAETPEGHRLLFRTTTVAIGVLCAVLAVTQLGFTGLKAVFGSSPKINVADLTTRAKNALFSSSGFGDYDPNRLLGPRIAMDSTLVLEVRADGPFYLRGRIYDTYTGKSWRAAASTGDDDVYHRSLSLRSPGYFNSRSSFLGSYYSSYNRPNSLLRPHQIRVTTKAEGQKYLFLPGTAVGGPTDRLSGRVALKHTYPDLATAQPLPINTEYSLTYWQPDVDSDAFQSAIQNMETKNPPGGTATRYQQIDSAIQTAFGSTAGLTARTVALAQSITEGCSNEFQKAAAIETWLRANCTYTLAPPQPWGGQDFVDYFLFASRRGYCSHFATAMTMLMRASGVPARYVEGYASPSVSESGLYEVTNAQAHAWVEYYSPLYGFITADPTPASALPRALTQAETQEALSSSPATSSAPSGEASSPSSGPSSSEAPSSAPSSSSPESPAVSSPGAAPGGTADADPSVYLIAAALVALLLLSLYGGKAAYRALWFAVVRRRNDREFALSLYGYFAAALTKLGFRIPPSGTPQELADRVRDGMRFGAVSFDRVTRLYLEVRFGERKLADGEREELLAFYHSFPAACRQKLGWLRYLLIYPTLR